MQSKPFGQSPVYDLLWIVKERREPLGSQIPPYDALFRPQRGECIVIAVAAAREFYLIFCLLLDHTGHITSISVFSLLLQNSVYELLPSGPYVCYILI